MCECQEPNDWYFQLFPRHKIFVVDTEKVIFGISVIFVVFQHRATALPTLQF